MTSLINNIGATTNLLFGYNSSWLSESVGNNALFPVSQPVLEEQMVPLLEQATGQWSFPVISLHDNPASLLDALLPYRLHDPSDGGMPPSLANSALLVHTETKQQDLKCLSDTLGVDLTNHKYGFALIYIQREDTAVSHPCRQMGVLIHPNPARIPKEFGVKPEFREKMRHLERLRKNTSLETEETLTPEAVEKYLKLFQQCGTHFVSKINLGDRLFQVLAIPEDRFQKIVKDYAQHPQKLSGPEAVLFRQYTTDANKGRFGYVQEYGHIISLSGLSALKKSLAAGHWQEKTFANTHSLFALFQPDAPVNLSILNTDYREITTIGLELSALCLFAEQSRRQVWQKVFKAGLVQKYTTRIQPNFDAHCPINPAQYIMQNELPGFLTNIATPFINTYKTSLNLADLHLLVNVETEKKSTDDKTDRQTQPQGIVKKFTLFCNHLYFSNISVVNLPGNELTIYAQLADFETDGATPVLKVNAQAFERLTFCCQKFYGALIIAKYSSIDHYTIVDGLTYQNLPGGGPQGRHYVTTGQNICRPPDNQKIAELKNNLYMSYTFSEASFNIFSGCSTQDFESFLQDSLLWLTQLIPAHINDPALLQLRLNALDLLNLSKDPSLGAFVPILPSEEYQQQTRLISEYVEKIEKTMQDYHLEIEFRKAQEYAQITAQTINENIVQSGTLLSGYIHASIEQQKQLTGFYEVIINQKKGEQKQQQEVLRSLEMQLHHQQGEVATAVLNYQQALKDWILTEEIKFGIQVASDLFKLGASFVVPGSQITAVKALGELAQSAQKILNASHNMYNIYTQGQGNLQDLQSAQAEFNNFNSTLSTNLAWDELSIRLNEVLASAPSDAKVSTHRTTLVSEFKILVLRGKAVTIAQAELELLARELYNQQFQHSLLKEQAGQLQKLNTNLSPTRIPELNLKEIDLIGLTGSLNMIRCQMLGLLAQSFTLQDQALRYTYLQTPTLISTFDTLGISSALITQNQHTIAAKEARSQIQAARTKTIDVRIEVPTEALQDGKIYQFKLEADNACFLQYVNTRVKSVIAKVDNISATDSHQYLLNLAFVGRPFVDRSYDRDLLVFNTLRRERTYEYLVDGNQPLFDDHGWSWSKDVTEITPFSLWEISLPNRKLNKGLKFTGPKTTITLSFILEARLNDVATQLQGRQSDSAVISGKVGTLAVKPPIETLITTMTGKSMLCDWDVVFNMDLDKINASLTRQYEHLKKNPAFNNQIDILTSISGASIGNIKTFILQELHLCYGYPNMNFLANNSDTCELKMLINSGSTQKGTRYEGPNDQKTRNFLISLADQSGLPPEAVKEEIKDGQSLLCLTLYDTEIPLDKNGYLEALITLSTVTGLAQYGTSSISVILDMAKGTFTAANLNIEMNDAQKIAFSEAVKAYFVHNHIVYVINSLSFEPTSTLPDLQPSEFKFKVLQTRQGNQMLQLYIQTNQRKAHDHLYTKIEEPIPMDAGCSLMISSQIFFDNVLVHSIQSKDWQLSSQKPTEQDGAWSATTKNAKVQGKVDLSSLDHSITETTLEGHLTRYYKDYTYTSVDDPVDFNLTGIQIKAAGSHMTMNYSDQILQFAYKETIQRYYKQYSGKPDKKCGAPKITQMCTDGTLNLTADLPVIITNPGQRDQSIKIDLNDKDVVLSARTSGGGACGSDDLQSKVNKQLKEQLPEQIKNQMNVQFKEISVFALKNLLFPEKNYLNFESVHVPGDLLIIGNFSADE